MILRPLSGFALSALLLLLLLSSCGTSTEEVWLNADGSGRYEMNYDASEMFGMLAMMGIEDKEPTQEELDPNAPFDPKLALQQALAQGQLDTVMNFYDILPDSARLLVTDRATLRAKLESNGRVVDEPYLDTVQQLMQSLLNFNLVAEVDKAAEKLIMGFRINFEKPHDIRGIFQSLAALKALTPDEEATGGTGGGMDDKMSHATDYTLQGNTLMIRQAANPALDELIESMRSSEADMDEDQLQQMLKMLGLDKHEVIVHLPGKVKNVEGANYRTLDENTVAFDLDYKELVREGKPFSANVKFKPKRKYRRTVPQE